MTLVLGLHSRGFDLLFQAVEIQNAFGFLHYGHTIDRP